MDLTSRGCLLNEPGDGLILSSFQILDQGDNEDTAEAKERVLDHFLDSLSSYENETHFKEQNSQWKDSTHSSSSTSQEKGVLDPFPLDLEAIEDHDGAMMRNFQPQPVNRIMPDSGNCPGTNNSSGGGKRNTNDDEEDDEDEDGEEEGEDSGEIIRSLEQQTNLVKSLTGQDPCGTIQLHDCSDQRKDAAQSKQQLLPPHSDYLDMHPVHPHSVYMDNATDDSEFWHHDSSKNDLCADLKPKDLQQQCLSTSEWDSDKRISQKGDLTTALESQADNQNQTWDFLHTEEDHHQPHQLLALPPHHPHPHPHWLDTPHKGGLPLPAMNVIHQQQQQQQQQQQHGQHQKQQWMAAKNAWGHNLPEDANDKTLVSSQLHWANHNQMAWHKDTDVNFPGDADVASIHNLFQMTPTAIRDPTQAYTAFPDMGHSVVRNAAISHPHQQQWSVESHHPTGSAAMYHQHQQRAIPTMAHCQQTSTTNFLQDPLHIPRASSACQFQAANMQPVACNSFVEGKKPRVVFNRRRAVAVREAPVARCKSIINQHRPNTHPYLPKDPKMLRDGFSNCASATGCNLKASHLVSWYIDYLIHENESLTQISRAFSLPVNLFHSDDFYFMDSVKKKTHFPSLKFLSWMRQKLPNININSVDFLEGRPPVASMWNQDWFWQNKSRRDIIHDIFFYFQHRRVAYPN